MNTKSSLVSGLLGAICVTSFAGSQPAPAPIEAVPIVIFSPTPDKPYTLTSVATPEYTQIRATNNAAFPMKIAGRLANLQNIDARRISRANDPARENEAYLKPGQTETLATLWPANSTLPLSFDYAYDFVLKKQQQEFDVANDVAGKRAHPMPPQSEWSKLPNGMDVAARGELEPFAWYMTPNGRPAQSLRYKATTPAGLGIKSDAEKFAEIQGALSRGESSLAVTQKQGLEQLRTFQRRAMEHTKVSDKDAAASWNGVPIKP
jgi:hypothetical protein